MATYSHITVPKLSKMPASGLIDTNPSVQDVVGSFNNIHPSGDHLALYDGDLIPKGRYSEALMNNYRLTHFQGMQRTRVGKHLIISGGDAKDKISQLFIVRMGTRKALGGWKSNMLTGVVSKRDSMVGIVKVDNKKWHAGGLSLCGDILAVPAYNTSDRERDIESEIAFFLFENPEQPKRLAIPGISRKGARAGAVGLIKLPNNGRFLAAVWSDSDPGKPRRLDFYLSKSANIFDGFAPRKIATWDADAPGAVDPLSGDSHFGNYQSINFVLQDQGGAYKLFLVGTYNTKFLALGDDIADLYELSFESGDMFAPKPTIGTVKVKKVGQKIFPNSTQFQFHMAAAGGVYIDPTGVLRIYSSYYWQYNSVLKFTEFRPVPDPVQDVISNINHSWIELYEDNNYGGRRMSHRDIRSGEYEDYEKLFVQGDPIPSAVSSARFQIPQGEMYRLFSAPNFKGPHIDLVGDGTVVELPDLQQLNFGDKLRSSKKV